MRTSLLRRQQALVVAQQWKRFGLLALLLMVVIVPAWSDTRSGAAGAQNKKTCYCTCDSKPSAHMCMQMCELPKYQNRSWANSCQKKQASSPATPAPEQNTHSKKRNRVEDAKL